MGLHHTCRKRQLVEAEARTWNSIPQRPRLLQRRFGSLQPCAALKSPEEPCRSEETPCRNQQKVHKVATHGTEATSTARFGGSSVVWIPLFQWTGT